jgi:1-acyl-sn-glycerol-3-phosphate acyltransferase
MPYRNIRLNPLLRIIYFLLRLLAWAGVSVFYRRRTVLGLANTRFDGPAIIISNHPSTLMDVLNLGLHIRQEMFFLANYGLFKHPVSNWLLSRLFCIPIKRREDVAEGEARDNDAAFEQSFRHLEANGLLYIAPEGVSWMERWVRPFKTGTARIAFGTEQRQGGQLGLVVLPIGLSYSAPNLFRSNVTVHYGAPVPVQPHLADWQRDPEKAVDDFTQMLEQKVRGLSLDCRDETGERFIGRLEELLQNERPLRGEAEFLRSKTLIDKHLNDKSLQARTAEYFQALATAGLSDRGLLAAALPLGLREALFLLLGFPLFAAGYAFWFLPCYLPGLLAKKMNLYIGYDSNVKTLAGLFSFGTALALVPRFFGAPNAWKGAAYMLTVALLGFFADWYGQRGQRFLERRRALALSAVQRGDLLAQRQALLAAL